MPSIIFKKKQKQYYTSGLILLCSGILMACGGSSSPAPQAPETPEPPPSTGPTTPVELSIEMPMEVSKVKMELYVAGISKPVYQNLDFSGFTVNLPADLYQNYPNKIVLAKITGNTNSTMYDPVLNKTVPFNGTMHSINTLSPKLNLLLSPINEAVYQRSVIRSDQFEFDNVDLTLIQPAHINKATSEITSSLHSPFILVGKNLPHFSNQYSITTFNTANISDNVYSSLLLGLGYMKYIKQKYPDTQNTYLELSQNLAIDLRDGHFDGRTLKGDQTVFKSLLTAPINTDVKKNTYLKIGETQQSVREGFGDELRKATLDYAINDGFQNSLYPYGIEVINNFIYYRPTSTSDNTNNFRWLGAGDYRPAFGLNTTGSCNNSTNPCRQGLNADDVGTYVNDVAYLIGRHRLNQCTIQFYPSGQVSISKGDKIYRSSINRDLSDNLQQINNDPTHYILNVGASENKPAYFLQFEVKDMNIVKARTGHSYDIYATTVETSEMDCGN